MATRVSKERVLSSSITTNKFTSALSPMGGILDSTSSLSGGISNTLKKSQISLLSDNELKEALPTKRANLNTGYSSASTKANTLASLLKDKDPTYYAKASSSLTSLGRSRSQLGTAWSHSDSAILDSKRSIVSNYTGVCGKAGELIQGVINTVSGAVIAMQEAALAIVDKTISTIVSVGKAGVQEVVKVLPKVVTSGALSSKIGEGVRSVLGGLSTVAAVVNDVASGIGECASLLTSGSSLGVDLLDMVPNDMLSMVTNNRGALLGDYDYLLGGYGNIADSATSSISSDALFWLVGGMLFDSIDPNISSCFSELQSAKDNVDDITNHASLYPNDYEWGRIKATSMSLSSDISYLRTTAPTSLELTDSTKSIISAMSSSAISTLNQTKSDLNDNVADITEAMDSIFDELESTASEYEEVKVEEDASTKCPDATYRTVL